MPLRFSWSRRALLAFLLVLPFAGGALAPTSAGEAGESRLAQLGALLGPRESVVVLGRAYLKRFPNEGNVDALIEALFDGNLNGGVAALRARLRARITRDFAAGRIVILDRWILSLAECRAFALVALVSGALPARPIEAGRDPRPPGSFATAER